MGGLNWVQADFGAFLWRGEDAAAGRLGLADPRGMAVYRNNYRAQLTACLSDNYPVTHAWLGDDGFFAAVEAHVDQTPPTSWTLDAYVEDFPATLAARFPDDPEVAALAGLELALTNAFIAADAEPLAVPDLGTVDWDAAILSLIPSVVFLETVTNAADIWKALTAGELPPLVAAGPSRILMIWRRDFICRFREVEGLEAEFLPRLADGLSFAALCAEIVARKGESDGIALAGGLLARWAGDGVLRMPEVTAQDAANAFPIDGWLGLTNL